MDILKVEDIKNITIDALLPEEDSEKLDLFDMIYNQILSDAHKGKSFSTFIFNDTDTNYNDILDICKIFRLKGYTVRKEDFSSEYGKIEVIISWGGDSICNS